MTNDSSAPVRRPARTQMAVLIVLSVCVYAVMMGSRMVISLSALRLTGSPAVAGAMGGVYSLMPILAGLAAGRLIDRFGLVWPVASALVVSLVGLLVPGAHASVWTLGLGAMAQGAAFTVAAMAFTNAAAMMGTVEDRTRNVAWVYLGNSAGMAVGPLMAGLGIDHLGHQGTFGLLALLPLVSAALLYRMRHRFPGRMGTGRPAGGRVGDLLRNADLRALLILQGLLGAALELFYFMVPLHGAQIGLSGSMTGTIVSCAFFANFASRAALPALVRRFGEARLMAATSVLLAVSLAPLGNVSAPGAMMLLAAGCGLTHGMIFPVLTSLFYSASPAGRQGEVGGVRTMVANASASGTQLATGALIGTVGIAPVMWAVGAVTLAGAWFAQRHVRVARAGA